MVESLRRSFEVFLPTINHQLHHPPTRMEGIGTANLANLLEEIPSGFAF